MKKSQQANQSNNNNAREQTGSAARDKYVRPRFHEISARHFRANSYVPLLLALRPRAGSLVAVLMAILGLSLFSGVSASAANLTLTIPSSALVVKATPNQFSKSEAQRISVSTDSVGGYTLKLSSKHGNTLNNTSNGGASKINPITSELTEAEFSALDSGGGSSNINVWGFKPSKLDGEDNSDPANGKFIAAPDSTPITLDTTSVANSDAANEYDITLGVKVDSTLPAGSYSNTFVLTATVNALKYDITYDAGNAEGNATNMPTGHDTGETSDTTIPLTTTIPEWSGYVFQGWCTVKPAMKSGRDDCAGTSDNGRQGVMYKSGAEFPLAMASTTTTLYAMWNELLLTDVIDAPEQPITFKVGDGIEMIMVADSQTRQFNPPDVTAATTTKWWPYYAIEGTNVTMNADAGNKYLITVVPEKGSKFIKWDKTSESNTWIAIGETGSYKTMQDLTQDECTAAGAGGMNVTDTRNNMSYTVGIVSNGSDFSRCWMYSNLRLEGSTEVNKVTLTPADSDVSENFEMPVPPATASDWVDYWSKKEMVECKGRAGEYNKPPDVDPNGNRTCNANTSTTTEFYYNWFAAIANDAEGTSPTAQGNTTENSQDRADVDNKAKGSICPKNWRLMEEGTAGDGVLITDHDEIDAFAATQKTNQENWPGRLSTFGGFWGDQQYVVGVGGRWWSASRHSDAFGRYLVLIYSGADLYEDNKDVSTSVRCILRDEQ